MKRYIIGLLTGTAMLNLAGCKGNRYDVIPVPVGTTQTTIFDPQTKETSKVIAIKIDTETGQVSVIDENRYELTTRKSSIVDPFLKRTNLE